MSISPKLEASLERLAKITVQTGADPGKVLVALMTAVRYRNEVWPHLTPQQRYAVLVKLRHAREASERRLTHGRQLR